MQVVLLAGVLTTALLLCCSVDAPVQYGLKPGSRYMFVNGKSLLDAAG